MKGSGKAKGVAASPGPRGGDGPRNSGGTIVTLGGGPFIGVLAVSYVISRRKRAQIVSTTATNHLCILRMFVDVVGDRPVSRLQRRHVEKWLETLELVAPATRRSRFSAVKGFVKWLTVQGYLKTDLMAEDQAPKVPRRQPRGTGQDGARRLILQGCPDARARLAVILCLQLGLRVGEVHRLQVGDINTVDRSVFVVGKGKRERYVRLTNEAFMALDDYLTEYPATTGPLVRSYRKPNQPLAADTISGLISQWMYAAGVKKAAWDGKNAHALRHQCAGDLLRNGKGPRDIQFVLGHAHLATTEIYLPTNVEPLAEIMEGRWYGREAVQ